MKMTLITKTGLKENLKALEDFAYLHHHTEWLRFCEEKRNGKQDIEELYMFIKSITSDTPWRFIISEKSLVAMIKAWSEEHEKVMRTFDELKNKLKENREIVSEEC